MIFELFDYQLVGIIMVTASVTLLAAHALETPRAKKRARRRKEDD